MAHMCRNILWHISPFLRDDSVNSSRCLVTVDKYVNNIRAVARQLLGKLIPAVMDANTAV
jgi:hypothetical protein